MDLNANFYNQTNYIQYRDAEVLINKIKEENINKKFDAVLDVGCGSGNVTLLLNSQLSINQLYAIDIDEAMIKFAKENCHKNNIQYLVQDLNQDWDQLRPELKQLEGKVSLIFSNHVLHWISNKENAAKTLFRLLSKDGRIYAEIYRITNPFSDLNKEEKEIHEKQVMRVPSKEEQLDIWINNFKNAGLLINESKVRVGTFIYNEQVFKRTILHILFLMRKQYFVEKDEQKRNEVMNQISDDIFKRDLAKCPQFIDETTGEEKLEFPYVYFRFVLQK